MARLALFLALASLAACSSSFGSGGGDPPAKTYIIAPNGQAVPVHPGDIQGGTTP